MNAFIPAEIPPNQIRFFPVYGCEPRSIGSTWLGKAAIGIPFNFTYKKVDDIDTNDITLIGNQSTNWSKGSARQLLESLVLSDSAKHYALLRELNSVQSPTLLLKALLIPCLVALAVVIAETVTHVGISSGKLTKLRQLHMVYATIFSLALIKYLLAQYYLNQEADLQLEMDVIRGGDLNVINGGVEYCEKLLKRNLAFRYLLGSEGPKYFSNTGNQVHRFGSSHLSITDRVQMLAEYDKKPDIIK
jgi:hypothetical protein